jgi:hypothetical protein
MVQRIEIAQKRIHQVTALADITDLAMEDAAAEVGSTRKACSSATSSACATKGASAGRFRPPC